MNSKRGSGEIFFRYFFLSDIQIVDKRKDKIKFNEIWHRMNRVKGGSFNSKGKTGIFLTVQTWQLWITSWVHFFIWKADIGIYCCSGLSSKTATKLQKKKGRQILKLINVFHATFFRWHTFVTIQIISGLKGINGNNTTCEWNEDSCCRHILYPCV